MPLNMKNIRAKKVQARRDLHHQSLLVVILICLTRRKNAKRTKIDTNQRNQAKNQKIDEETHLRVTATVKPRRRVEEEAPVIVIHIKQKSLKNRRSTKRETRNENGEKIRNQDTLNLLTGENLRSIEDLDRLVDDNMYKLRYALCSGINILYTFICITLFNKTYFSKRFSFSTFFSSIRVRNINSLRRRIHIISVIFLIEMISFSYNTDNVCGFVYVIEIKRGCE